ncbi:hypothetical protein GCM10009673_05750 [Nesterenkonia sandarakina]
MGVGAAGAFLGGMWFGVTFTLFTVVVMCAVLSLAIVVVAVGHDGLTVRSRVFRVRLMSVPRSEIASVSVQDFRALSWGGWGLRWRQGDKALALDGDQAVVIRKNNGRSSLVVIRESDQLSTALQQIL